MSSFKKLVEHFSCYTNLPIEVDDVRQQIISMGIQDDIIITPAGMDPAICRGVFYRFRVRDAVYGEPKNTSLILFSDSEPTEDQRVAACKELIHVLDPQAERVDDADMAAGVLTTLVNPGGPGDGEENPAALWAALTDGITLFRALMILFPEDARTEALEEIAANRKTVEQIAAQAALPLELVRTVLSTRWTGMCKAMLDTAN